ncbi:ABC transporter substrate-binding protein [Pseudonocardia acidicola]|uniref:ABC transporter substrate-binding protein n=1 Tax=Pseudonocardia acidicola TaxID=2724939 RepID=A0ABX1S3T4_9PSEU|nr:ABC transporter substrate-binding protein [Pseudonocardia acidicola]NMH95730.1 ABC transporter substrate-binding protein [Pseudonocardia acidicola]
MSSTAAGDAHRNSARTAALTGLISHVGGGRRPFVDATGTSVALPARIRRLVATDPVVGALLLDLGAPLAGCAGDLAGVEPLGAPRDPDPGAVAGLRPDLIVTGAVDRVHDLVDVRLLGALRGVAPVVAVDVAYRTAAVADLRALLGVVVERRGPAPALDRPPRE